MTLPRYAVRVDHSSRAIVDALRQCGFHVELLKVPVDALVSRRGLFHAVEFKTGKGKLTPAQVRFQKEARAPVVILRDAGEAIAWQAGVP